MQRLKQVLAEYSLSAPKFGDDVTSDKSSGDTAVAAQRQRDRLDHLRKDIRTIIQINTTNFRFCFGALVVLYIALFLSVIIYVAKVGVGPAALTVAGAGFGTAFAWIIRQMIRLWKEKVAADLSLSLAANLNPEDVKTTLEIVLRTMK